MAFPRPARVSPPSAVVFDAYGTLLSVPCPRRPYMVLRELLAKAGACVDDFAHRAMSSRQTLAGLALGYGVDLPTGELARLDALLWEELESVRPYPEAERALRHAANHAAVVVVASNLAWPYALPVRTLLDTLARECFAGSTPRLRTAFSFELGLVKPAPGFYQAVAAPLHAQGVEAARIFMVGDRQAEDVDGPRAAGWQAWRVDRRTGQGLLDAPWDAWFPPTPASH